MTSIVLFTDFGPSGPYIGQMESVLRLAAPNVPVINLLSNAPTANPRLSSYLLAALRYSFPVNGIFLAVVDPGVGGERRAVVLQADGQRFVGPDNGLLNTVAVQAQDTQWSEIIWKSEHCSMSFHGRDIFAPVAARLAINSAGDLLQPFDRNDLSDWPQDLEAVIYFDYYGNAMTGLRYHEKLAGKILNIHGIAIKQADTFGDVEEQQAFWYKNSSGLVEIAVNKGHAQQQLGLTLGMEISFQSSDS
ncbi:MAG: SAM-dependent chlorinase/fluorinase [Methylobacter sp.]|uniref:SAM hydrolase/SAM-dependent halogenase family protein n=1 Tax=Methylobacter sp. TaxID=2051955 RepID=UPI00273224E5|nr:SAM-dependent chlorinase/fluorinase [Methylobacter sp.]MDP1663953.1 SAM-dependent chlorinase/fluorinase [Methylobacter sp.]MDP1971163.1 SAM-dependent chlorinase/fluorinase [Methylobacter sp.]